MKINEVFLNRNRRPRLTGFRQINLEKDNSSVKSCFYSAVDVIRKLCNQVYIRLHPITLALENRCTRAPVELGACIQKTSCLASNLSRS